MARPFTIEQSQIVATAPRRAFDVTLPIPLTVIFARRYGLLPPIVEVRGQEGVWGRVGQSRTVVTADGGTMREVLTGVEAARSFSYLLGDITGPMRPLVHSIDGHWEFAARGMVTVITWRWTMHPRALAVPLRPLIAVMWHGYARQALDILSGQLLTPTPTGHTPG